MKKITQDLYISLFKSGKVTILQNFINGLINALYYQKPETLFQ